MHGLNDTIPVWRGIGEHIDEISAVICDLWGVLHDGQRKYTPAVECLARLRESKIPVALLSNSPKPVEDVWDLLVHLGIDRNLADTLTTSGSLARDVVKQKFHGSSFYHIGPAERDASTIAGLPSKQVDNLKDADFIFCTGLDAATGEEHRNFMKESAEAGKVLICANPDRIVHIRGNLFPCAGVVGDVYNDLGGPVIWAGKPDAHALKKAANSIGFDAMDDEILMIGDSLQTDIAGAMNAGCSGLLVAGGIHRDDVLPALGSKDIRVDDLSVALGRDKKDIPTLKSIIPSLKW